MCELQEKIFELAVLGFVLDVETRIAIVSGVLRTSPLLSSVEIGEEFLDGAVLGLVDENPRGDSKAEVRIPCSMTGSCWPAI